MPTFDELIDSDITNTFLNGEFSQAAVYNSSIDVTVQFFESPLDKMETTFHHAWVKYSDVPNLSLNDTFEVLGVVYGVMDFSPDEFNTAYNIYLQKKV